MKTSIRSMTVILIFMVSASVYAGPFVNLSRYLDRHIVAEKAKALCSELEHRPKDSIRVKHVGNDHYEVEFSFAQTTDENGRKEWIFLDEKAFTLVYNRETKKFSFLDWNEVKEWKKTKDALGWKK